jgi:hypothetical protein
VKLADGQLFRLVVGANVLGLGMGMVQRFHVYFTLRLEVLVSPYHCCVSRLFVRRLNRVLLGTLGVIEQEEDG